MKFPTPAFFILFLALACSGCDFQQPPSQEEKSTSDAPNMKLFAADPPHKQVEKILAGAKLATPEGSKKEMGPMPLVEAKKSPATPEPKIVKAPFSGQKIYQRNCALCHDQGVAGAPSLGKLEDWTQRMAKGQEILIKNALQGFQGSKGVMPARGGNPELSDADVEAAVLYMIDSLEQN